MPVFREYRITLPLSLEEYRVAQLYMVAKYSAAESAGGDGDGVEILKNEPYKDETRSGQYTHKIYHLASKLPAWLVSIIPKKALMLEEKAWNAYPYCMTILTSHYFTKFKLQIETMHISDRGTTENALKCDSSLLSKRIVETIDIAKDPVEVYVESEDPTKFKSKKTGRGPLTDGWFKTCEPVMCAYKFVTVDVPYWGFGQRLEKYISKTVQRKVQTEGHKKAFCWMDEWFGLTMDDIRKMEDETFDKLNMEREARKGNLPNNTSADDLTGDRLVEEVGIRAASMEREIPA